MANGPRGALVNATYVSPHCATTTGLRIPDACNWQSLPNSKTRQTTNHTRRPRHGCCESICVTRPPSTVGGTGYALRESSGNGGKANETWESLGDPKRTWAARAAGGADNTNGVCLSIWRTQRGIRAAIPLLRCERTVAGTTRETVHPPPKTIRTGMSKPNLGSRETDSQTSNRPHVLPVHSENDRGRKSLPPKRAG